MKDIYLYNGIWTVVFSDDESVEDAKAHKLPTNIQSKQDLINTLSTQLNKLVDKYKKIVDTDDWTCYDSVVESDNLLNAIADLQYKIDLFKEV